MAILLNLVKSKTFAGGRGEHILRMLSGQLRGNKGSFHEHFKVQCPVSASFSSNKSTH